jgi:hypothetical protein
VKKKKWENESCESVEWMMGAELEDLEDVLVIWIGQMHTNSETATDEVIKEHGKGLGEQMSVTNFVQKNLYVFCSKN